MPVKGGRDKYSMPIRLPQDLNHLLTEYALENGYSKNTVIIMALREFLQAKDGQAGTKSA